MLIFHNLLPIVNSFIEHLLCVSESYKSVTGINCIAGRCYQPHFIGGETGAQRGYVTFQKSHS